MFFLNRLSEKNVFFQAKTSWILGFLQLHLDHEWVGDNCVLCHVLYWISIDLVLFSEKVMPTLPRNSLQDGLSKIIELMTEFKLPREV